jgi:hypothetical protein
VAREGIFADTLHQCELLQEMWPAILPQLASVEESLTSRSKAEDFLEKNVFRKQHQ